MYFYFARFKPTSLQMTPGRVFVIFYFWNKILANTLIWATVLVPLLDFILQVLPLLLQLFKRISDKVEESREVNALFDEKSQEVSISGQGL